MKNMKSIFCLLIVVAFSLNAMKWDQKDLNDRLFDAIERGTPADVEQAILQGADIEFVSNLADISSGCTPLLFAAILDPKDSTLIEKCKVLIQYGANIHTTTPRHGCSVLHRAAVKGNMQLCKLFLDSGVRVDVRDGQGRTPLMALVNQATPVILNFLIRYGADINAADQNGNTYIFGAVNLGRRDLIIWALEHGANPHLINNFGDNLLTYAKTAPTFELAYGIKRFLELFFNLQEEYWKVLEQENVEKIAAIRLPKAFVNCPFAHGQRPLDIAIKKGNFELAACLLKVGAWSHLKDNDGLTAQDLACVHEQPEILELLRVYEGDSLKKRCVRSLIEARWHCEQKQLLSKYNYGDLIELMPSFFEISAIEDAVTPEESQQQLKGDIILQMSDVISEENDQELIPDQTQQNRIIIEQPSSNDIIIDFQDEVEQPEFI